MPLISVAQANPLIDGRQSEAALAIRRGVMRHFRELGVPMLAELPLASGRRADLIGTDRKGGIVIVEIKSSLADWRADSKWPDYLEFCDSFYFATHGGVPQEIFPADQGLIVADPFGAAVIRYPRPSLLPGARRKALLTRIARAAADRLDRVLSHCDATGLDSPRDLAMLGGD